MVQQKVRTSTGAEAFRAATSSKSLSTGSKTMDGLLGGGLARGKVVEFYGKSGSGKTQLAMQASLFAASAGLRVLYMDTEGAFRPERVEEIAEARGVGAGGVLERIVYMRTKSFQEQMEAVREMEGRPQTAGAALVVVDTLTRNFTIGMPGRRSMSSRQSALNIHLSEMARDAVLNRRAYLVTNRVTFGPEGVVGVGGLTVENLVHASVMLERRGDEVVARLSDGKTAGAPSGKRGID